MSRKWISYEVILQDAEGNVIDRHDSVRKTPVKQVFKDLYVRYEFGGVTGLLQKATLAFPVIDESKNKPNDNTVHVGEPVIRQDGWTLRIETTIGRSYV